MPELVIRYRADYGELAKLWLAVVAPAVVAAVVVAVVVAVVAPAVGFERNTENHVKWRLLRRNSFQLMIIIYLSVCVCVCVCVCDDLFIYWGLVVAFMLESHVETCYRACWLKIESQRVKRAKGIGNVARIVDAIPAGGPLAGVSQIPFQIPSMKLSCYLFIFNDRDVLIDWWTFDWWISPSTGSNWIDWVRFRWWIDVRSIICYLGSLPPPPPLPPFPLPWSISVVWIPRPRCHIDCVLFEVKESNHQRCNEECQVSAPWFTGSPLPPSATTVSSPASPRPSSDDLNPRSCPGFPRR